MPELGAIGSYHPQIVHFVIALAIVGVLLRLLSLTGRIAFAGPAAATLILLAAGASVLAAASGDQAHGPAERVPGARNAVVEHEEWGERARNALIALGVLELVGLALARRGKARYVQIASGVVGLVALFVLYEAAEHGGELVYGYAGGVGLQRKDPADVGRLLLAGLYHQAELDRKAGKPDEAAALVDLAARRFPADVEVQLWRAESALLDRKDAAAATAALAGITPPADQPRLRVRHAILLADALAASGQRDAARASLTALAGEFPDDARLKRKLQELGGS
jgi:uncharacterized membrane protein